MNQIAVLFLSLFFLISIFFFRGNLNKEEVLLNFSYGVVILSIYINIILFLKILNSFLIYLPLLLLFFLSIKNLIKKKQEINLKTPDFAFFMLIGILLFILSTVFPYYKDELVYHLEVPRQFWINGGFIELKRNFYSYFPEGIENIYLIFLSKKLFYPQISRFIHSIFLILTGLTLSILLEEIKEKYLFILFFFLTPTLFITSTYAYIDSALMFFFFMGIYSYKKFKNPLYILFFALLLPGIKYTGIFYSMLLILLFLIKLKEEKVKIFEFKKLSILISPLLFTIPFYIKNFILTGNPLFPFYAKIFGNKNPFWNMELDASFTGFLKTYGNAYGGMSKTLSIFFASTNFKPEVPQLFDGVIGIIGIIWLISIFFLKKISRENRILIYISICGVFFWSFSVREIRFLFFLLPLFLFLFAKVYEIQGEIGKKILISLILIFTILNFTVIFSYFKKISLKEAILNKNPSQFLEKNVDMYKVSIFLNKNTPKNSKIFLIESSNENFYLNRRYISDYIVTDYSFYNLVKNSESELDLLVFFKRRNIDYILMRKEWIYSPIFTKGIEEKMPIVENFFKNFSKKIYDGKIYEVFRLVYKNYSKSSSSTQYSSGKIPLAISHPISARFSIADIKE